MRSGEISKMRWKDVDMVEDVIRIPQQNSKVEKLRKMGITSRLKFELSLLWDQSPKTLEGSVFGISDSVKRSWKTACDPAKVHNFRLHDCRHTATTRMIASGTPHVEVMKITGHSQLKTFLRYLNHRYASLLYGPPVLCGCSSVSGESCTDPNSTVAPRYVCPIFRVPISGLTY